MPENKIDKYRKWSDVDVTLNICHEHSIGMCPVLTVIDHLGCVVQSVDWLWCYKRKNNSFMEA